MPTESCKREAACTVAPADFASPRESLHAETCPWSARRELLRASFGIGIGFAASRGWAQSDAATERPKEGDLLVRVGSQTATPLKVDDLILGAGQILVWPMDPNGNTVRDGSRLNKILLLRLDPGVLDPQTAKRAAGGVVAYSAICPHTGCEVVNWLADKQILDCPCHNSEYDPKAGAKVTSGPSPRGLAALPLRIVDGRLSVAQPFIGKLGIQQV